ncbi:YHYH protein [Hymenobacter negativus]|uniref:YHYH protein n=1 Tax=Hymenobacter negativus TaxID=2795026 RepID=A0ABS3QE33_9BACT|nr:YHYH protein [Hymenobacter negativus]MBO2009500.1 YHYH protein [Hymenobacter negativus]
MTNTPLLSLPRLRHRLLLPLLLMALCSRAQLTSSVTSWLLNTTGATGYNGLPVNVQQVRYSTGNVYVNCSDIPAYTIGPWAFNPNVATNQNYLFKITRTPLPNTGTATATPLGNIGLWSNGTTMYNAKDGISYNNLGIWNQNAVVWEGSSFDACLGHPDGASKYHHHLNPKCLYNDRDSSVHSPLIGFALDGYPIYGTYGYRNASGTGGLKSMKSSYRVRNITARTTRTNGAALTPAQYGPTLATYALGYYIEDYEYVAGSGDLDDHNGRFAVTPEYPAGTYAYYITLNSFYEGSYPYTLGPTYYGVIPAGTLGPNSGTNTTVAEPVTTYTPAVDLTVSSTQSVPAGNYHDLTITGPTNGGPGVATLAGIISVTGTVLVKEGGVLNTNCQAITGAGSFTLAAGGTLGICSPAGITASSATGAVQVTGTRSYAIQATYIYNGTTAQVTGNGLPSEVRNLTLANATGLILSQSLSVNELLVLNSGTLTTSGNALTLLSGPNGTASALNAGTGAVSGNVTVQRYISPSQNSGTGYRHLSAPVGGTTVASLTMAGFTPTVNNGYNSATVPQSSTPFPTIFGYEQSRVNNPALVNNLTGFDRGWYSPASLSTALTTGQGYTVNLPATTFGWTGPLNTGSYTTAPLSRGSSPDAGWHLVGNPYPSTLDWGVVAAGLPANIASSMYVFESSGPYAGSYRSYVNGVGNPLISSSQGFFVRSLTVGQSPTLTFANAARNNEATLLYRGTVDARPRLELNLTDPIGQQDRTTVYWQTGATPATDAAFDAWKIPAASRSALWTEAGADKLSINGLPLATGLVRIPLNLSLIQAGTHALRLSELANIPATWAVQLEDRLSGTNTPLTAQTNYVFNAVAGALNGRFWLVVNAAGVLANTASSFRYAVALYPNPAQGAVQVSIPAVPGATHATLTLSDALGRAIRSQTVPLTNSGALATLPLTALAPGVYIIRTQAGGEVVTQRVVVE